MSEASFAVVEDRLDVYRDDLFDLLRIPGVSATGERLGETAEAVEGILDRCGFAAERIGTSGAPLVYGEAGVDPTTPTVLFYGHYDVQPAGDPEEWDSPPFEPTIRDGSIYARGSGDNKGQVLAHAFAVDALRHVHDDLPVTVKVLIEGEEESGSDGLRSYLATDPDRLACDLIYVSDGPMHRSRRPTLIFGNRGILAVEVSIATASTDLHSGNFGGPVPNAGNRLVSLLSTMVGPNGEILVDGVGDDVAVTPEMRQAARDIPVDAEGLKRDLGVDAFTVPDAEYYERLLVTPNASVNGLKSGYGGPGMKTIVPHEATGKVDFRLVPDQDPDRVFERVHDHVSAKEPAASVERLGSFPPVSTPLDIPLAEPVRAALQEAWGDEPVELPLLGGSLPAAYLGRAVDAPILVVPYANPDQNNHAPNEHLDQACFENGIRTSVAVLERLSSY